MSKVGMGVIYTKNFYPKRSAQKNQPKRAKSLAKKLLFYSS
nr:hypothetical protein [uncultured Campylobacter sp.]